MATKPKFKVTKGGDYIVETTYKGRMYRSSALTLKAATDSCKRKAGAPHWGSVCFVDRRLRTVRAI